MADDELDRCKGHAKPSSRKYPSQWLPPRNFGILECFYGLPQLHTPIFTSNVDVREVVFSLIPHPSQYAPCHHGSATCSRHPSANPSASTTLGPPHADRRPPQKAININLFQRLLYVDELTCTSNFFPRNALDMPKTWIVSRLPFENMSIPQLLPK